MIRIKPLILVISLLPFMLLPGCGKGQKEAREVTITLSFFDRLEKWKGVTDDCMKENPDIKIDLLQFPGNYIEKIGSMFAAGSPPDVIFIGEKASEFASRDALLDLTPYIEKDKEEIGISDIYPQFLELCKYKGKYFALPVNAGSDVIFYNKNIFDKAGLKYPDETLTYTGLVDIAQKLTGDTDGDGRIDQYGLYVTWNWWWVSGHILKWGGDLFNSDLTKCLFDRPENIEAIRYYSDLIKKYKVSPSPVELKTQGDTQLFMAGKLAMFNCGWYVCQFFKDIKDFSWDVAPVPGIDGKRLSYGGINWILISKNTKHPEESWRVVKYITGEMGQEYFLRGGFDMPVRKSVTRKLTDIVSHPENRKVFIDSMEYSRLIPEFPKKSEVTEIISQELDNIFYKDIPVEEGCKRITERVNKILVQSN